ncbi:hypothetical protein GCM10010207_57970 [Streptomyces atratus]|nr:hypothetical protein GCM10010207_57970 [Streptomyces atratus]
MYVPGVASPAKIFSTLLQDLSSLIRGRSGRTGLRSSGARDTIRQSYADRSRTYGPRRS